MARLLFSIAVAVLAVFGCIVPWCLSCRRVTDPVPRVTIELSTPWFYIELLFQILLPPAVVQFLAGLLGLLRGLFGAG